MEEVFVRFVHLGEQIFKQLDNKDLKKCNNVSKSWDEFTSAIKLPWFRMIKEYVEYTATWHTFFKNFKQYKFRENFCPILDPF